MNGINLYAHKTPIYFSYSKQIRLRNPLFSLNDGRLPVTWQKNVLKFSVRSANSDGGRPLQPGRSEKEDDNETSLSSYDELPESVKQEKITALFRRILSSISKAEAKRAKKSPTESIPKVPRQPQKPNKATATKSRKKVQVLSQKQLVPNKDEKMQKSTQHSQASINITRPPSNFVKKSPIPSPSIPRGKQIKENSGFSVTTDHGKVPTLPLEEMKLTQLKELAKSRAIKGYSKLKKSQLLELLSSQILEQ
ncbi:SAP-like protein BP-73 isoform X2 [Euphorbia lathyris]|uniref:SAP-like protein BP-73 isoform X2 n=1 Tax=Euphorbia lathyris TaxID=212925 RepID=UPI0033139C85